MGLDLDPKVQRVLDWVNDTRLLFNVSGGAPLADFPRARKMCATGCVIAQALSHTETGTIASVGSSKFEFVAHPDSALVEGPEFRMPTHVRNFICAFDSGKYPEYVERRGI